MNHVCQSKSQKVHFDQKHRNSFDFMILRLFRQCATAIHCMSYFEKQMVKYWKLWTFCNIRYDDEMRILFGMRYHWQSYHFFNSICWGTKVKRRQPMLGFFHTEGQQCRKSFNHIVSSCPDINCHIISPNAMGAHQILSAILMKSESDEKNYSKPFIDNFRWKHVLFKCECRVYSYPSIVCNGQVYILNNKISSLSDH